MNKYLLLLLINLCSLLSIAQQPAFKSFWIKDGLPSNKVYYVFQDHKGLMWFGTDRGVSHFDGSRFSNFSKTDGLGDNEVFGIREDSIDRLWFLTNNGIPSFFQNENFHSVVNKENQVPVGALLYNVLEIDKNNFLFATGKGILKVNPRKKSISKIESANSSKIYFLWKNSKNQTHALTDRGIFHLEQNQVLTPISIFENPLTFSKAAVDSLGNLLFSNKKGLFRFSLEDGIQLLHSSPQNEIIAVKIIEDEVWLGKRKGVFQFKIENVKLLLQDSFLLEKSVTAIEKDFEGGYWFSTLQRGVFYASKINVKTFPKLEGCKKCYISFVKGDDTGAIWLGGHEGFLMEMKEGKNKIHEINHFKSKNSFEINHAFFKDGKTWLFNNGPSACLSKEGFEFARPGAVHDAIIDESENIWIASSSGVWKFPWKFFKSCFQKKVTPVSENYYQYRLFNQYSSSIFKDKKGKIWVGTNQGLYFFENGKMQLFENDVLSSSAKITDISEVGNVLLVATAGDGLFLLGEKNYHFKQSDGLASNYCNKIITDISQQIYIGTSNGISLLKIENEQPIIQPFVDLGITEVNDIFINPSTEFKEEKIYVATSNGLAFFGKDALLPQPKAPLLYLKNVFVNDIPNKNLNHLPFDKNDIQFQFSGISYSSATSLEYQYLLKGLKNNWQTSENSTIEFLALPHGRYELEAKVCFKNSSICSNYIRKSFQIQPPFWQTWWFRFVAVLGFAGVIYSFFKIRILTYNRDVVRELIQLINARLKREHFVMVKDIRDGSNAKIPIQKIQWIESNRNYLTIHLPEKQLTSRIPMKEIEEKLNKHKPNPCIRIHRSYIVNKKQIEAWHSTFVKIGDKTIPIGNHYKKQLAEVVGN